MRIKVFKASDVKEAMTMVKNELGSDAVILHTKRYRKGGFLGLKGKEVVEVTAAVDDEPQRPRTAPKVAPAPKAAPVPEPPAPPARPQAPAAPRRPAPQPVPQPQPAPQQPPLQPRTVLAQYKTAGTEAGVVMAKQYAQSQPPVYAEPVYQQPPQPVYNEPVYAQPQPAYAEEPEYEGEAFAGDMSLADLPQLVEEPAQPQQQKAKPAPVRTPAPAAVEEKPQDNEKIQALEKELAQMREMLQQVMSQKNEDSEIVTLQSALLAQDVSETVMQDMAHNIKPADMMADKNSPEALKALKDYLLDNIKMSDGIILKDGRAKVVALIGTTGVGKTTTLAKIAAKFVLERGVSAALITADTYRISAVEQLKTYSDIIGLPLEIVYSPAELKAALRKFRNKQLVLIDTAGRSQNNEYQMNELVELLAVDPSIEKHLVMSATTKERDALAVLERFSECQPDRVMFTKTDETDSVGGLVNLLFSRHLALSYLTHGQSVPDDITSARPEALAKLLLR